MSDTGYVPPRVWTWDKPSGGSLFGALNRPVAGPTHEAELPVGQHPLQLYSLGTPNGQKVTILLEELLLAGHAGAEYDAWYVDILKGEQFSSGFVAANPNSKIPALIDRSGPQPVSVFESGAIMLHLAEKFGAFIPADAQGRAECLSWLMWQMASAPMIGSGFGHFFAYAPEKNEYAINRFTMEVKRLLDVADRRLAEAEWFAGSAYSIADIAVFGWLGYFHRGEAYAGALEFLDFASYRQIDRWCAAVAAREGVRRGSCVNRDMPGYAKERHSPADIDAVLDPAASPGG